MKLEFNNLKILCAVTHGLYEPWISILKQGQETTWLNQELPPGFNVIHFHGIPVRKWLQRFDSWHESFRWSGRRNAFVLRLLDTVALGPFLFYIPKTFQSSRLCLHENVIEIGIPDVYFTLRWKLLGILKYFVEETNADYIFMTTTSSYVQPELLMKYLSEQERNDSYYGAEPYLNACFASGSNRILSRSLAKKVLQNRSNWSVGLIEDVALSNLVKRLDVPLILRPIINLQSIQEVENLPSEVLNDSYHFRLKSISNGERNDVLIMKSLHERVLDLRNG